MQDNIMSQDTAWVVDLFQMQLHRLRVAMDSNKLSRKQFDKYSYGAWAITETFLCIDDASHYQYLTVSKIIEILRMQLYEYRRFYELKPDIHIRYKYAYLMTEKLLDMTCAMYN